MSQKECPACAVQIDNNAEICPICGYEFPTQPLYLKVAVWVMIFLLIIWLVL
ncbi:zinc ribbon domain-containing protein [Fodinibius saliphilus]|uniref:zinc ribbon domain-containing protein n=1 Tax=Fodinibius saliphilus TaxID=1920650 RepID=UPI0011099B1D